MRRTVFAIAVIAAAATITPAVASAQVTTADYARAQGLREKYEAGAVSIPGPATWVEKTTRFWYRRSVKGGFEFVVANAATAQKRPAFDHEKP